MKQTTTITQDLLPIETWEYKNYSEIRQHFEDYLTGECGYSSISASESDDWRDEFIQNEYKEYIESITRTMPIIKDIMKKNFIKFAQKYPQEAYLIINQLSLWNM